MEKESEVMTPQAPKVTIKPPKAPKAPKQPKNVQPKSLPPKFSGGAAGNATVPSTFQSLEAGDGTEPVHPDVVTDGTADEQPTVTTQTLADTNDNNEEAANPEGVKTTQETADPKGEAPAKEEPKAPGKKARGRLSKKVVQIRTVYYGGRRLKVDEVDTDESEDEGGTDSQDSEDYTPPPRPRLAKRKAPVRQENPSRLKRPSTGENADENTGGVGGSGDVSPDSSEAERLGDSDYTETRASASSYYIL
jgi:hypothetical protein